MSDEQAERALELSIKTAAQLDRHFIECQDTNKRVATILDKLERRLDEFRKSAISRWWWLLTSIIVGMSGIIGTLMMMLYQGRGGP